LLVASLCLVALQYLPFHVLSEDHHASPPPLETAGIAPEEHEDHEEHGPTAPAHPALDHPSATPACRALSFGTDLATTAPVVLAPPQGMPAQVALADMPVPPSPDIGPVGARGPPAAAGSPDRFPAIPA
jgi:hypothetical protein